MTALLSPRLLAGLVLAIVLALSHFTAYRKGKQVERLRFDAVLVAQEREAVAHAERNRELMRQAERRYVVQQGERDRFIVTTVRELSNEAAPLAACPVPEPARVRLNSIRECAIGDSPASCGADGGLRSP